MPELRSRQDNANWRTPILNAVLKDEGFPGLSKTKVTEIWEKVAAHIQQPFQLLKTRSMPDYVMFQIDVSDATGFAEQLDKNLAGQGWIVGVQQNIDRPSHYDIFIQTGDHRPLTLRQALRRVGFRKSTHPCSFVLGVNLQQQVLVRNLGTLPNLLLVGEVGTLQNFVRSMLATLLLTNTPSELRFALIGKNSEKYTETIEAPHTLGRTFASGKQGARLLYGMALEVRRRRTLLETHGLRSVDDYNLTVSKEKIMGLPRILLVVDSVFSPDWSELQEHWLPNLVEIMDEGQNVNVNLIMTTEDLVSHQELDSLFASFATKLMTRNYAADYLNRGRHFGNALLRFIDAVIVENTIWHPAEYPSVTALDTKAIVKHWRDNSQERSQTVMFKDGTTKQLTDLLNASSPDSLPVPPTPARPSSSVLVKATDLLSHDTLEAAKAYVEKNIEETEEVLHKVEDPSGLVEVMDQFILKPDVAPQEEGRDDQANEGLTIPIETIRQAQALATYLGWLGRGPLIDVLGVSVEDADLIIAMLQARQLLERSNTATPRTRPRRR